MRVVIIVQARMGSSRLPGKVLAPLAGAPMLARQLERLSRCKLADQIVIATTDRPDDTRIVNLAVALGYPSFRGPEDDVLSRFLGAASESQADVIVRVTADCPMIDAGVVDAAIGAYLKNSDRITYVSNSLVRTYPRGLDVEVFSMEVLAVAAAESVSASDREHVTPFIWRQPERFPRYDLTDEEDNSDLRWTVDTPEDLELIRELYALLVPDEPAFTYKDALALVRRTPHLADINRHVRQKAL